MIELKQKKLIRVTLKIKYKKEGIEMDRAEEQIREYEHQADLQRLRGLRPIDDDFMRCLFKDNIELVEFVLRIITGKEDLVITEKDFYGEGKAIYPIERINLATGQFFEDGEHILYVNGEYRGESEKSG